MKNESKEIKRFNLIVPENHGLIRCVGFQGRQNQQTLCNIENL